MHEMTETFQNLSVNAVYACAAAVGTLCIVAMLVQGARKLTKAAKNLAAVSLVGVLLIGAMVVVGTDGAGSKPSTNDVSQVEGGTNTVTQVGGGTNDWTNVEGTNTVGQTDDEGTNGTGLATGPLMLGRLGRPNLEQALATITDDDIAAGWRVVSVSSNVLATATFTMPMNATVWESAQAECKMKS